MVSVIDGDGNVFEAESRVLEFPNGGILQEIIMPWASPKVQPEMEGERWVDALLDLEGGSMAKVGRMGSRALVVGDSALDVRSKTDEMLSEGFRPSTIACSAATGDWYEWWYQMNGDQEKGDQPEVTK